MVISFSSLSMFRFSKSVYVLVTDIISSKDKVLQSKIFLIFFFNFYMKIFFFFDQTR